METIRSERNGAIQQITLARGKANAVDRAMVEELNAAVEEAGADPSVRGLVLASARPRFFSSGFDAAEVFGFDRDEMGRFFGRFIDLYERVFHLPKPVVAAVSGHAYAGGAILALAADVRVMAEGDFGFALNEVNLGLVLPGGIIRMAVAAVGMAAACDLLLSGRTVAPPVALRLGLAHDLAPPDGVLERAVARARELADKPAATFGAIKRALRAVDRRPESPGDRHDLELFLDHWFSPEALERKQALSRSLGL